MAKLPIIGEYGGGMKVRRTQAALRTVLVLAAGGEGEREIGG